ncbi:MAG: efflux RND transporter periplasmic adaptor subunit [Bryobacteraceae bacterium]
MNDIDTTESQLRAQVEDLRRQLEEQKRLVAHHAAPPPSSRTFLVVVLLLAALAAAGYYFGYEPRQRRETALAAESVQQGGVLPVVNVEPVERSRNSESLVLPGNIEALTEAPVLARAAGYIQKRYVDIGDRVKSGQPMAEIDAPELRQQILQAKAAVDQAAAAVEQAQANLEQGRSNERLAQVTAQRFDNLFHKGVISRQDNDNYQTQWAAQTANAQALAKAVDGAQKNLAAAQANVARLNDLFGYLTVRAPFDGVVTVRNVDVGALVNDGSTLLFRVAQTGRLRIYLNVPQSEAGSVHAGQSASISVSDRPNRKFPGTVTRTSDSLDPATRTLLVEVQIPNGSGLLLPGMFSQVDLIVPRTNPPLVIPSDALVVRSDGPQVAVVDGAGRVHFTHVQLGRDFGDRLEALSGVEEGQMLAINPSDAVREGAKVKAVHAAEPAAGRRS